MEKTNERYNMEVNSTMVLTKANGDEMSTFTIDISYKDLDYKQVLAIEKELGKLPDALTELGILNGVIEKKITKDEAEQLRSL